MKTRKASFIALVLAAGTLVGCANQKTSRQAAAEQWSRTRATVLLSLANDQYRSGNLEKCGQTVEQAMAIDPTNIELHILKARLQIEEGQLEGALQSLALASSIRDDHAEVDYLQGVIHQRWQRPERALECYSNAASKKPDDIAYLMAQSEMLVTLDRQQDALELLRARVVYFEHSPAIRDAIGQLYEQVGDRKLAIEYYRQASVLDPADDASRERLALALYRNGDYQEAVSQLQRLVKLPGMAVRTDLLIALAESEAALKLNVDARRHFEQALATDEKLLAAWLGIARTSLSLGDLRRAESSAARAVSIEPRSAQAQMLMGYVRMKQGRYDEAMVSFRRASEADATDPLSFSMVGLSFERKGSKSEAIKWYGRALEVNPSDALAMKLLADARN